MNPVRKWPLSVQTILAVFALFLLGGSLRSEAAAPADNQLIAEVITSKQGALDEGSVQNLFALGGARVRSNPREKEGYLLIYRGYLGRGDLPSCFQIVKEAEEKVVPRSGLFFSLAQILLEHGYPDLAILYLQSAEGAWAEEHGKV